MITISQLEEHFQSLPTALLEIVVELRNLIQKAVPEATEEIRRYGMVYYWGSRGGPVNAGICQILIKPDHIRLAFIHGAFLPDPDGLLKGSTWPKRYMRLDQFDQAPWEQIQTMIELHSRFDPYSQSFRTV